MFWLVARSFLSGLVSAPNAKSIPEKADAEAGVAQMAQEVRQRVWGIEHSPWPGLSDVSPGLAVHFPVSHMTVYHAAKRS